MGKVLVMVRTSTELQSTSDQKKEMIEFCKSEGYEEKDIVVVERQGASAAKVDDDYREMIDEVKRLVEEDKEIECYAVWHLNRAFRTEEVYIELKTFFVRHHVQIICKNPYLKLLTPEGKVDPGMELAMGLLAILAKQDQDERKAKFKRAKKSMAENGKYIGGHIIPFGYKVVDGYYCEDETEGEIVKTIFDLYSTGKYSTYTLSKELEERGKPVKEYKLGRILRYRAYTGEAFQGEFATRYPPIISKELFDKCEEIRKCNKIVMKKKKVCLGAKLVKCPECGATCTSNTRHYVCSRHSHHGPCSNGFALRKEVADELMYRFAFGLHLMYLMRLSEGKMDEYRKELEILDEKLAAGQEKMSDFTQKKQRIIETYLEGFIDKKSRDLRLSKLEDDARVHRDYLNSLQGKRRAIAGLLETDRKDTVESFMKAADTMRSEDKYSIIHQHIEKLVAVQESFGKRDPRTTRPNAVRIVITSVYGTTAEYMYFPKYYQGHNLMVMADGEWCPDRLDLTPIYLF